MISNFYQRKGKFSVCEDSFTAVTFDGLKCLPDEVFWKILTDALLLDKFPADKGYIESITFWDKWDAENTKNSRYVEPDVFVRTSTLDLIIEAKRYNEKQQYKDQMENQIQGYFNEFIKDEKPLYYLQLAGLQNYDDVPNYIISQKAVIICKTNWSYILQSIVKHKNEIEDKQELNSQIRILADIIKGFELHQFYSMKWLRNLPNHEIHTSNFDFLSYTINFKSNKNWLIAPLKNLSGITITNTRTNNLFEYARATK